MKKTDRRQTWTAEDKARLKGPESADELVKHFGNRSHAAIVAARNRLGVYTGHDWEKLPAYPKTKEQAGYFNRLESVRSEAQALARDNKNLRKQLGGAAELVSQVVGAVDRLVPYPVFHYKTNPKTSSAVVPVLCLSDWHIGEVVSPDETEGFNQFNWRVAKNGVLGLVQDFLNWVQIQRTFYPIHECAVFCEGDFVSGDIHSELQVTNEFPLPVQAAKAGWLLGEVFRILSAHFSKVTAYEVAADNHGRLQKKPQAKQKSANNMTYLVHVIANSAVESCKNFVPVMSEGMKAIAKVNGKRFLLQHGDNLRGVLGIPFYAFAREIGREATKRMGNLALSFDYMVIGHFHSPTFLEGRTIVNGSLSGTSEFDHACGRHAVPCQVAFLVHPRHGIFNFTPFSRRF